MKCKNCNGDIDLASTFCGFCGAAITKLSPTGGPSGGAHVSPLEHPDRFILALATAPLWGFVVQIIFTKIWVNIVGGFILYRNMWWVAVACNIGLF